MTRIAIVSTNAIGDTYLSASAVAPLRRACGDCRIHFVTLPEASLMMPHIDADEVSYLASRSAGGILSLLWRLRKETFQYVFQFFPGRANTLLFRGLRGMRKAGFTNLRAMPQWHDRAAAVRGTGAVGKARRWEPSMPVLERVAIALEHCGIPAGPLEKIRFSHLPELEIEAPDVLIHPYSRVPEKSLSPEGLHAVSALLLARGRRILLIGSASDPRETGIDPPRFARRDDPPLPEFVTLIRSCAVFIGVDSFPLHVADAYRTDFTGLFAPTDPAVILQHGESGIRFPYPSLQAVPPAEIAGAVGKCFDGKEIA